MEAVGIIAAALLGVTALFQISLAGGAPWGAASWGGRHPGKLAPSYRIASGVVGVVFYPVVALVALGAAGLLGGDSDVGGERGVWIITGLFAFSTVINLISRSKVERLWGPVAFALTICFGILAAGV